MGSYNPDIWRFEQVRQDPPGDGWTRWTMAPPAFKRDKVVEVWRPTYGNVTGFLPLGDVIAEEYNVADLWWRPA